MGNFPRVVMNTWSILKHQRRFGWIRNYDNSQPHFGKQNEFVPFVKHLHQSSFRSFKTPKWTCLSFPIFSRFDFLRPVLPDLPSGSKGTINTSQPSMYCRVWNFAELKDLPQLGWLKRDFPPLDWVGFGKKTTAIQFLGFFGKVAMIWWQLPNLKTFVPSKFHIDIRHPQCNNRQLQQIQRQRPNRPKREPYASGNWWQYHLERHHRCAAFMGGWTTHGLIHPSKSSWPQSISINQ